MKVLNNQAIVKITFNSDRLNVTLSQPSDRIVKRDVFVDEVLRITDGLDRSEYSVSWFVDCQF